MSKTYAERPRNLNGFTMVSTQVEPSRMGIDAYMGSSMISPQPCWMSSQQSRMLTRRFFWLSTAPKPKTESSPATHWRKP